jgi:hypothetical protein
MNVRYIPKKAPAWPAATPMASHLEPRTTIAVTPRRDQISEVLITDRPPP